MNKNAIKCGKVVSDNMYKKHILALNKFLMELTDDLESKINRSKKNYSYQKSEDKLVRFLGHQDYPVVYQYLKTAYEKDEFKKYLSNFETDDIDKVEEMLAKNEFEKFVEWYQINHSRINSISRDNSRLADVQKVIFPVKGPRSQLNRMIFDNPFVSLDIQRLVEVNNLVFTEFRSSGVVVNLYQKEDQKVDFDIQKVLQIVNLMCSLAHKKSDVTMNILLTNLKKKLGSPGSTICPKHANSGSSIRGRVVNVWRTEELDKVLIHEMVHFLGLDMPTYTGKSDKIESYLTNRYNIDGRIVINEAYTEVLAVVIHTCYFLVSLGYSVTADKFRKAFDYEVNFSLFQCAKILNHFGLSGIKQLESRNFLPIKQRTAIFSYFFVKTALLLNGDELIKFISQDYNFGNRFDDFMNLMIRSLESSCFIAGVDHYLSAFQKADEHFVWRTLRMSCLSS